MAGKVSAAPATTVKVLFGDALEELDKLAADGVQADAVIADPPYCSGAISEMDRQKAKGQGLRRSSLKAGGRFAWFKGDNMGTAGIIWMLRSLGVICSRALLKKSGSLIVFCDWRMLSNLQPAIESSSLRFQSLIVWDKQQIGLGRGFRAQHELALHFTNGEPEYYDASIGNVIRTSRVSRDIQEHPTQKPVPLLRAMIRVVSPRGGLIVDPFCGSGSTGVAAVLEGRSFVGVENDEDHLRGSEERIARAVERMGKA